MTAPTPREVLEAAIWELRNAAEDYGYGTEDMTERRDRVETAHAALLALTRREPLDVLMLAAIIRAVDGNHDLGASALAEAIIARLGAAE